MLKTIAITLLVCVSASFLWQSVCCDEVTIPGLGVIRGSTTETTWEKRKIYRFLGIPYAEPPVDDLRFKVFFFLETDTFNALFTLMCTHL